MEHGGNIYQASREMGIPGNEIMDFSASINPLGLPSSVIEAIREGIGDLPNYPETYAETLVSRLASHLCVDRESVVCGNGSTELIYLVARSLNPQKVLIPAPTFSEYERACKLIRGARVVYLPLKRSENFDIEPDLFIGAMKGCDMAFLCNPNNPTGRLIDGKALLEIVRSAEKMKCCLVIDEAFVDFSDGKTVVNEVADNSHLVVLRSLTKFYALSGLRIGYGVFPLALAGLMRRYKEPWTVNTLAQRAGIAALQDEAYREKSLRIMMEEKNLVERKYAQLGLAYIPSSANYNLIQMNNAAEAVASLRKKGILIRDCSNFIGLDESYVRIAIKSHKDNAVLHEELSYLCRE